MVRPRYNGGVTDLESNKSAILKLLSGETSDISIIDLVDHIVTHGYLSRASDIHIEPADDRVVVRFRIDGMLTDVFKLPKQVQSEVVSRIKVLSGLKSDIHHMPQDGRFKARIEEVGDIDMRVSIAPTYYGENCVMRILAESKQEFGLADLGFTKEQLELVNRAIRKPYGMILANGPTGAGKTTTLYAILKKLNTREVSIITIEDPIEYSIAGITQMPVNVQSGFSFANGLRSILRQDPNIVMVGEIRDPETAGIAVNAALTGHLMLSTLHTNDASTTFPRLIDMGVPPFLVASTVNVVISQRLVRMACPKCRVMRNLSLAEVRAFIGARAELLEEGKICTVGKGCDACEGFGYRSRIGIHEVLEVNDNVRGLITGQADANYIKQAAIKDGMKTMLEDGIEKAKVGITTVEEVVRIIHE